MSFYSHRNDENRGEHKPAFNPPVDGGNLDVPSPSFLARLWRERFRVRVFSAGDRRRKKMAIA